MRKRVEPTTSGKLTEALRLLREARDELKGQYEMNLIRTEWMVNEAVAFLGAPSAPSAEPEVLQEEVTSDA